MITLRRVVGSDSFSVSGAAAGSGWGSATSGSAGWLSAAGGLLLNQNRRYGGHTASVVVEMDGESPILLDLGTGQCLYELVATHADEMIYRLRLGPPKQVEFMTPSVTRITGLTQEEAGARVLAWADERGATHLELDSADTRTDAHRFYEREGAEYRSASFGWTL